MLIRMNQLKHLQTTDLRTVLMVPIVDPEQTKEIMVCINNEFVKRFQDIHGFIPSIKDIAVTVNEVQETKAKVITVYWQPFHTDCLFIGGIADGTLRTLEKLDGDFYVASKQLKWTPIFTEENFKPTQVKYVLIGYSTKQSLWIYLEEGNEDALFATLSTL